MTSCALVPKGSSDGFAPPRSLIDDWTHYITSRNEWCPSRRVSDPSRDANASLSLAGNECQLWATVPPLLAMGFDLRGCIVLQAPLRPLRWLCSSGKTYLRLQDSQFVAQEPPFNADAAERRCEETCTRSIAASSEGVLLHGCLRARSREACTWLDLPSTGLADSVTRATACHPAQPDSAGLRDVAKFIVSSMSTTASPASTTPALASMPTTGPVETPQASSASASAPLSSLAFLLALLGTLLVALTCTYPRRTKRIPEDLDDPAAKSLVRNMTES